MSRRKLVGCGNLRHEESRDFFAGPRHGELKGLVNVGVALGHTSGSVTKQGRDRQFGKSEITGDTAKGMAQRVRSDALNLRGGAESG